MVWVDIYSRNVVNKYLVLSIITPSFSMITANSSLVIRSCTQDATHWTAYEWCGNVCVKATVTVV